MSEINKIDLSRFVIDDKDIARSSIDVYSEAVKNAVEKVTQLNEKTVEQTLIVKQQEAIEELKEQRQQLLAKLGAIGALMKEKRYDEALALLTPNCEQVVREIQADAVVGFDKWFDARGYDANDADEIIEALNEYANQLRNPEQGKV